MLSRKTSFISDFLDLLNVCHLMIMYFLIDNVFLSVLKRQIVSLSVPMLFLPCLLGVGLHAHLTIKEFEVDARFLACP